MHVLLVLHCLLNVDPYAGEYDPDDMDHSLMFSVVVLGPGNTRQQEYKRISTRNLDIVDRYLGNPCLAPVQDKYPDCPTSSRVYRDVCTLRKET